MWALSKPCLHTGVQIFSCNKEQSVQPGAAAVHAVCNDWVGPAEGTLSCLFPFDFHQARIEGGPAADVRKRLRGKSVNTFPAG